MTEHDVIISASEPRYSVLLARLILLNGALRKWHPWTLNGQRARWFE